MAFSALSSRNYRLFFGGQGISLIGTWMTQLATVWLVYQLTDSAWWLGVVGFTSQIPSFVLAPIGGALVDRWNTHRILVITQTLAMIQSLALATLALTHMIALWQIVCLSLFQGLINALDAPARQTFVREMVDRKEDLSSAIALNSSLFNGGRLIGPAIAGLVIARVGAGYCFLIDGISYIAVIAALLAMRIKPKKIAVQSNPWQRVKEGFNYAFNFSPIRSILLLLALFSLTAVPYTTLVPIFATKVLHGSAHTLGFIMAASGIGALSGGLYLSTRRTVIGLGKIIAFAPAVCGVGIIVFALSQVLWLSLLMSLIIGLGTILAVASSNTVIQTIVEDDKRGRVMSLFTMALLGMAPFGNLIAGSLASRIGASTTLIIGGTCCILGSLLFARQLPTIRRLVRPIYTQAGIISAANS